MRLMSENVRGTSGPPHLIVGGALLLHRGADVSRLEMLLMALIFFSVAGYVLAGPPWPRRRKKR